MSIQSELIKFNDKIRVDFDKKVELREKREVLLRKLRKSDKIPSFKAFNQGSYALYTGVTPESGKEYDIDVALRFSKNKSDYDPIELKNKVREVLQSHTEYGAEIKTPCVTVTYKKDGEASYHVDLVVYLYEDKEDENSQLYIAKGKCKDSQSWEKADPEGLVKYINEGIEEGAEREQYRRVVRYLKKWKNRRFSNTGHASPASIGLTLMALETFIYCIDDDLNALLTVVSEIENKFIINSFSDSGKPLYRIKLPLPDCLDFESDNDVFIKMSDAQMTDFKDKISKLKTDLTDERDEVDEQEQYKKLNKIFGDDFEVPKSEVSAKKQFNYVPHSSASGIE